MANEVKLTVRLPGRLHARLARRARAAGRSLNATIIASLSCDLDAGADASRSPRDVVLGLLRERGLWHPELAVPDAIDPSPTHAELRREAAGVPGLSDLVIEDRGPR